MSTLTVKVAMTIHVSPQIKRRVKAEATARGLSASSYGELALALYSVGQLSASDNCSKQ